MDVVNSSTKGTLAVHVLLVCRDCASCSNPAPSSAIRLVKKHTGRMPCKAALAAIAAISQDLDNFFGTTLIYT